MIECFNNIRFPFQIINIQTLLNKDLACIIRSRSQLGNIIKPTCKYPCDQRSADDNPQPICMCILMLPYANLGCVIFLVALHIEMIEFSFSSPYFTLIDFDQNKFEWFFYLNKG